MKHSAHSLQERFRKRFQNAIGAGSDLPFESPKSHPDNRFIFHQNKNVFKKSNDLLRNSCIVRKSPSVGRPSVGRVVAAKSMRMPRRNQRVHQQVWWYSTERDFIILKDIEYIIIKQKRVNYIKMLYPRQISILGNVFTRFSLFQIGFKCIFLTKNWLLSMTNFKTRNKSKSDNFISQNNLWMALGMLDQKEPNFNNGLMNFYSHQNQLVPNSVSLYLLKNEVILDEYKLNKKIN